jgi:hypothetical protein
VERFIKTLKNFILKILVDPNVEFNKFADLTTQLIQRACVMYNNRYYRTIQARPIDVFEGRDINKQEIIRFEYEEIPKDTIVLRRPFKEEIGTGVLDYDVELYVVEYKAGNDDKYYAAPLYNYVCKYLINQGKLEDYPKELVKKMDEEGMLIRKLREEKRGLTKPRRAYKPYELRVLSARELVDHANSNLFKWSMTNKYGIEGLRRIINYIKEMVLA